MLDDDAALGNDSRYKSFVLAIEKVLKQFEFSAEWPDLIANLVKLKKIIETCSQFQSIPKRIALSKRLAQCLHPALPSGVHLKALEVYETIFRIVDQRHLQCDIILYSYGLFSLLPVAALPVKPVLLTLYERYFLSLGEGINPILIGFLISLFSALEEGADYYNRVILLLDNLANRMDEFYFYTCIWSAIDLVASVRYSAITFLLSHFDKRKNMNDQIYLIGLSVETTVSAVCTCLYDNEQALVQRTILDFLLTCLPIHRKELRKESMIKITTAMLHVILKRDMSLNRRVYAWFFGSNDSHKDLVGLEQRTNESDDTSSYFVDYTQEILIDSLRAALNALSIGSVRTPVKTDDDDYKSTTDLSTSLSSPWTLNKLIRVLLVLVDKPDVGPNIIEAIFMNYLLLVYIEVYRPAKDFILSINAEQEHTYIEALKTFNMLLDTLEPYFIWEFLVKRLDHTLNETSNTVEATLEQICGIINMLLDIFSSRSSADTDYEHLLEMLYRFVDIMNDNLDKFTANQTILCLEILMKILKNLTLSDTNPHLSENPTHLLDRSFTDSDDEDENDDIALVDNEYSTDIYNKLLRTDSVGRLQSPDFIIEQENLNDIERLLRQMVRKVEKQVYKLNNPFSADSRMRISTKTMLNTINYIDKSVRIYRVFFHQFIVTFLFDWSSKQMQDHFQTIRSTIQGKTAGNLSTIFHRYQQFDELRFKLSEDVEEYAVAFEDCCKLLIRFCSFPRQTLLHNSPQGITQFEDWSVGLFVLSLSSIDHFSLQTIALSVLIELLPQGQIVLLSNDTDFFQYIIAYLWEYLSEKYSREYNSKASRLLSMLHSILPNNLCEDLICEQLSTKESSKMEEYKKFFKLWNSNREQTNERGASKSFQYCLMHVLNTLKQSNNYCLKTMIQQWIYDRFVHGDMARIFDILLLMLLHADTARTRLRPSNSIDTEQIIFDQQLNGEITFSFVFDETDDIDELTNDEKTEREGTEEEKRLRTISCMSPGETIYPIKSSSPSTKLSIISSLSQPILFNIRSFSPPLLSKSVKQRAPTLPTISDRDLTLQTPSIHDSSQSQSMPNENMISKLSPSFEDANEDYSLFYVQSYDYNRVTLSLNIIESLIELIPQQLLQTLLTTSPLINTTNAQMHKLVSKHFRSIRRRSEDNPSSYLYVLLNTLFIYTCSYHPKCFDIEENRQVQIHSLRLLTRICHDLSYLYLENSTSINDVISLLKKVSFQKKVLFLFDRIISAKSDSVQIKRIYHYNNSLLHDQMIKQYLKELIQLLEETILLENLIYSTDALLSPPLTVHEPIFLSTILQYLKQIHLIENHRYMISLVVRIFPHCNSALKTISSRVMKQICRNLCFVIQCHQQPEMKRKFKQLSSLDTIEYIIYLIQRLSYICLYCLGTANNNPQPFVPTLCPQQWMKKITADPIDLSDARQSMLGKFPLILSSLIFIWKSLSIDQMNSIWLEKNIKQIRETIIEFLSSLTKSHGVPCLRAAVQCWGERKKPIKSLDNIEELQALINMFTNITGYSVNDMIANVYELLRNQTWTNEKRKSDSTIWSLQFILAYFEKQAKIPIECWPLLVNTFRECLSQSTLPSVTFLIIKILSFYAKQSSSLVEKRDLKDLQDIIMRALDNCNTIVGSSLEQTTWLRKNLQVRLDPETNIDAPNDTDPIPRTIDIDGSSQSISLIALTTLAEHAPKLLDIVYNLTDEKDRLVVPYLQNLVFNVMPYVRTHVFSNASAYRSASTLLQNISQYSYTRKAWRKEVFEQLFDTAFFQVDIPTLSSWKVIIANVIVSNEKATSFRDVMTRINTVQTGFFVFKDQEHEQRAMLIKRFAFVIYASEKDQYNRHLPEILECITDLLKLAQIPVLYTQIFLVLRVLIIRISSKNLISFWPIFMAELIQILSQLEQDLLVDTKSTIQRMTTGDLTPSNISQPSFHSNATLKMYLYACKLLDVLLAMPYSELYHFQFFRSAFVSDHNVSNSNAHTDTFISFAVRLSKLLEQKLQSLPTSLHDQLPRINRPLLRLRSITNVIELFPFFNCLTNLHIYDNTCRTNDPIFLSDNRSDIETSVLEDFIESWS